MATCVKHCNVHNIPLLVTCVHHSNVHHVHTPVTGVHHYNVHNVPSPICVQYHVVVVKLCVVFVVSWTRREETQHCHHVGVTSYYHNLIRSLFIDLLMTRALLMWGLPILTVPLEQKILITLLPSQSGNIYSVVILNR